MKTEQRVIACVDQSSYADSVADHAAWAALRLGAPLELLHVIDRHPETARSTDHSGAIGPDAQEALLTELSSADETMVRAAREQGRVFLNRLRERALAAGVAVVDMRQRLGHLEETLNGSQGDARLVVMGRKGETASQSGAALGGQVERVVRALERPILAVADTTFREPRRLLLAYDGGSASRKGVEMVAASPLFRGMDVRLVMVGNDRSDAVAQMAWATGRLQAGGVQAQGELVSGEPLAAIQAAVDRLQADWLLMGAYTHSPWRSLFRPSLTSGLLGSVRLPTLLLR
ncbi:MAG: universal stress protein [Burkholderiaceae bacterium]